ncbi:MAG: DUF1573 domain-containing protein [Nibricoccus sp.]
MQIPLLRTALLIVTVAFFEPTSAHAELRFAQTSVQLKATAEDQILSTQFSFQNDGTEAVFVASLTTSCTCTSAQIDKMHFAPGETGVVSVTYKIGSNEGPQSQIITLLTNEKDGSAYTLTFKADIPKRTRAELPHVVPVTPTFLFWSKKPFQTKTVNVDLRGLEEANVSATCTHAGFKVSINDSADKQGAVLEITPADSMSDVHDELIITIKSKASKVVSYPVALTIRSK